MVTEPQMSVKELLMSSRLRVGLIICLMIHIGQPSSGIIAIMYYSVQFFESAGVGEDNSRYANLGVGAIMIFMSVVTIPLMDRLGRRIIYLTSTGLSTGFILNYFTTIISVGALVMTICIIIAQNLEINTFLISATMGFIILWSVGLGTIPWLVVAEIFTQGEDDFIKYNNN